MLRKDQIANEWINKGDRARDAGDSTIAAQAYRQALILDPARTDIRVQYANMLKDSCCFAEGEAAYRHALSERPNDGDIHLQLGHLLKMQGRRTEAIASYERALALNPTNDHARHELVHLGVVQHQIKAFAERLTANRLDLLPVLADEIARMRLRLDQIASLLPELRSQVAFPFKLYETYRNFSDIPAPPRSHPNLNIDVVLLVDHEPLDVIYKQIESILNQSHQQFALYAVGHDITRKRIIDRVSLTDERVSWVDSDPNNIAAASERRAILRGHGDWIILLAPSAVLHRNALGWFAEATTLGPSALICDEEVWTCDEVDHRRLVPVLRHIVDYDTLLEMNVYGATVAVRRDAYLASHSCEHVSSLAAVRAALLLDLASEGPVCHIPLPLLQRPSVEEPNASAYHAEAVSAHITTRELSNRISLDITPTAKLPLSIFWHAREPRETITIIIPTRDNAIDLISFVHSMRTRAHIAASLTFLIVVNGIADAECGQYLDRLGTSQDTRIIVIDEPFNWSRLNNGAVANTVAPIVLFANDDMLMLTDGWDERLRGLLSRPEIGAVGAKLLYPNDTIQHAGILFDWQGSTIHDGIYEPRDAEGPANRWIVTRTVSAVTGAFLATRRDTFLRLGGFDELHLPVACSDIDYALKLRADGRKVLWTPHIVLYHHESKSRGFDHLDPERRARCASELAVLRRRWGAALEFEPTVNPTWAQVTLPFRLISAVWTDRLAEYMGRSASHQPWHPSAASPKQDPFI